MRNLYLKAKKPLWLAISGALTSLALIFTELGALQWISIIPMALILMQMASDKSLKLRKLYGAGVIFFGAYYSLSFHWFFYMYPLDFAGLSNAASLAVVLLACFGIGIFQALQSALIFVFFGVFARGGFSQRAKLTVPLFAASLWVIFEWWQTVGWWGVPWARLPLGQMNAVIFVRSASLFGSYFITFIIVAVNFCLALAIYDEGIARIALSVGILVFSLNLSLGSFVTLMYRESGEKVKVAAVQGNISSNEKWSGSSRRISEIYGELTEDAAREGAEIVVWSETALPYVLFNSIYLTEFVSDLARDNDITILLSAFTESENGEQNLNSIIEVRSDGSFGETVYSKQKLVPFGEFVPMREFVTLIFPPLANIGMLDEDLLAGETSVVIETEEGRIGCGLCFDSIYEDVILNSARNGAELIAISTNDSWFSDSAALDMHNAQARLRAIESGKYVVRSANTGISSIIDPMGDVRAELGALKRGYVISEIEMTEGNTLYTYIGNLFVYLNAVFSALMLFFCFIHKGNIKFIKKT